MPAFACPKCGSDHAQRLRVIYESGTQTIRTNSTHTFSGVGVSSNGGVAGGFGSGSTSTSGVQQTALAQQAAPPNKRSGCLIPLIVLGLGLMATAGAIASEGPNSGGTAELLFFAGLVLSPLIAIWVAVNAFRYNGKEWRERMQKWESTYLCQRCGTWFLWS